MPYKSFYDHFPLGSRRCEMPAYAITVTCVVAVSSVIVFLIFYRMKVLNFRTLISVTLASLITALGLPALFSLVSSGMDGSFDFASPAVTLLVSVAAYLLIVVILSMIISFIINGAGSKQKKKDAPENGDPDKASAEDDNYLEQIFVNFISEQEQSSGENGNAPVQAPETDVIDDTDAQPDLEIAAQLDPETAAAEAVNETSAAEMAEDAAAAEMAEDVAAAAAEMDAAEVQAATESSAVANEAIIPDSDDILANIDENAAVVENNLEISVDSKENIDKMGIENIVHNRNTLTLEDCISEAFRLKGTGDFESAILYHMYALDRKPGKDLTFWIILDICVMYKSLGQQDLALDILNSYYETYGDMMDVSMNEEIRKNLTAV